MRKIIAVFIALTLFVWVSPAFSLDSSQVEAKSAARSMISAYKDRYGSSGAVKSSVRPLLSPVNMTTLNGETAFNAQIECPNPYPFLQILFQPTQTNDFTALISQDTNGDGKYDYQLQTPLVSGVCTNGFISCDAGTWDNCRFYTWVFGDKGEVSYKEVATDATLGTCFCVNNSCSGSVFNQFSQIASTFGQGLADRIASLENFAISNVQSDFPTLTYYGQSADKCSTGGNTSTLRSYYGNAPAIQGAAESTANQQLQNENSAYYAVVNSEYVKKNPVSYKTCEIKRQAYISNPRWITDGGMEFNGTCQTLKKIGNNLYECFLPANAPSYDGCGVGFKYFVKGKFYVYLYAPDDFCAIVKVGNTVIYQTYNHTGGTDPETYTYSGTADGATVYAADGNSGACNGVAIGKFAIFLKRAEDVGLQKSNGCSTIDESKCKLKDEQVCDYNGKNCVYTVRNFLKTGVHLLQNCQELEDKEAGLVWNVCANGSAITYQTNSGLATSGVLETGDDEWWYVKRTYECKTDYQFDVSAEREENVVNNGQYDESSGTITYPDTTTKIYGIGGYSGTFQASYKPDFYDSCQYTCVVTKSATRTNAIGGGNEAINANSPSGNSTEKEFIPCKKDAYGQWYCPASGDETVLQPCTCLDMGARSIAVFSASMKAAKDLTCSKE